MRRPVALVLALLGMAATLLPWILVETDVWESGVHDGLWFSLPLFLGALLSASAGVGRALVPLGILAALVAGIELPGVYGNAFGDREGAVGDLLAQYSRRHFASYALVLGAGLGLALIGLRAPHRARADA